MSQIGSIKGCSLIRTFLWSATQNCIGSKGRLRFDNLTPSPIFPFLLSAPNRTSSFQRSVGAQALRGTTPSCLYFRPNSCSGKRFFRIFAGKSAKILCLGIKKIKIFCSALDFSYLWFRRSSWASQAKQIRALNSTLTEPVCDNQDKRQCFFCMLPNMNSILKVKVPFLQRFFAQPRF